MNVWIAALAAVSGYLIGSLSFARIVMRMVAPERKDLVIQRTFPGTDEVFESHSIAATFVKEQIGPRYGCLTALLDALKAALPALIFLAWKPDAPYYLVAATLATVGHNYPIYYRFDGGSGLSTIYGGFLVLDWLGVIVTNVVGTAVGILAEQVVLMRWTGLVLMIPWIWFRTRDPAKLIYVVVSNALFWIAMIPVLRQYFKFKADNILPDSSEIADLQGVGSLWKVARRFSIPSLIRRISDK